MWRQANVRLVPAAFLSICGAIISSMNGNLRSGDFDHRFFALIGILLYVVFAVAFLRILTGTIQRILSHYHFTTGRAAALQFMLRVVGYIIIFLITLDLIGIPIEKLVLGGAAIGIILGVAAQQALSNFFASIVLITSHPYSVGDHIVINSGALGGKYSGVIKDIGLTHTHLKDKDDSIILLPNATVLAGATIMVKNKPKIAPNEVV
ncbi:hypothetical protein BH09PAT3_BH09PAT3_0330 [soil metagenome]